MSSNSWGYIYPGVYDSSILTAIDYAIDAGVYVVVAAGKGGELLPRFLSACISDITVLGGREK